MSKHLDEGRKDLILDYVTAILLLGMTVLFFFSIMLLIFFVIRAIFLT